MTIEQFEHIATALRPQLLRVGYDFFGNNEKAEDVAQAAVKQQDRNNNFSDQALDSAWETYISSHPTAHILINTMRVARPQRIEGNRFVIMVENPGQVELMKNALPDIISYLANQLSNDHISFEITINEVESSPHVWNSREVFAHMLQEVPHMQELVKRFDLTLS